MWWVSGLCQSCPLSDHEAALVSSDLASTLELPLRHQLPGFLVRTQILGSWAQAPVFLRSSPVNPASHNCALVKGRELSSQPGLDEPTMVRPSVSHR